MSEKLDGRSQDMVRAELVRRATALLGPDGAPVEPGTIETALIGAAARIFEEVTRRLDKVPGKQADNFYAAMGIGRDPALPARVPVAFKLSDTAPGGLVAPAGTRLTADTGATPTIFETGTGIALVRGKVAALTAADLGTDSIYLAPSGVVTPALPAPTQVTRNVRSAAGAGATMVQVDPVLGLAKGMTIRFTAEGTPEYDITEVKNDVVSFAPALTGTIAKGDPLFVVDRFAPFTDSRNRQGHALYLSHPTMLDVAGALTITVAGVEPGQPVIWEWFGSGADGAPAGWHAFKASFDTDHWALEKGEGKPEKTIVDGRNALWIRGRLDGSSAGASLATRITMAVSSGGLCARSHDQRCTAASGIELPAVEYDAVAVTTPVVPNKPYYPFGREPRLYDAFYIGCAEAFGKAGAEVSLCLSLGGASLERIVAVAGAGSTYMFGVGTDHQIYAARFGIGIPTFSVVPGPRDGDRLAELPERPHLSARIDVEWVRLAVAGIGAVYLAEFPVGTPLVEGAIRWTKLAAAPEDATISVGAIVVAHLFEGSVHAMVGTRLQCWRSRAFELQSPQEAYDLIPVQNRDAALLIVDEGGQARIRVKQGGVTEPFDFALVDPGALPAAGRAACAPPGDGSDRFYIAGYDDAEPEDGEANLQLVTLDSGGVEDTDQVGACPPLPITFEPPISEDGPPVLLIATAEPRRFLRRSTGFEETGGVESIGESTNPVRQIVFAGERAMTQHWDRGLLYRAALGDQLSRPLAFAGTRRQVADDRDVPGDALYFVDAAEGNGSGYLIANGSGDRLLLPLTPAGTASGAIRNGSFFRNGSETGTISESDDLITLTDQSGQTSTAHRAVDLLLSIAGQPFGTWHLRYDSSDAGWKLPSGSPDLPSPPANSSVTYQLLDPVADAALPLQDYFELQSSDALRLSQLLLTAQLRSFYSDFAVTRVQYFGNFPAIRIDHELVDNEVAVLTVAAGGWTALGPSDPANPALSWEYWNGASWWALDTEAYDFSDRTANLQISQGIFFKAPANLAETEVGGRKNLWIRARLVGGDYGEAKVTVTSEVKGSTTEQTVTRDLSAIRAPYIISLKINYCVTEAVKPAIVVTADNLGMIDQTNANDAGLPVTIFLTVAEALAPQAVTAPDSSAIPDCCREMPAEADTTASTDEPEADAAASRAVLIGFDQPIDRSPLSLFIDAVAHGGDWAVEAALFRAGRFEAARVARDDSSGLAESGVISIEVLQPPDRVVLFGTSAYWLRLTPKGDASVWSPRLRGVYLNGVIAASTETRAVETIGTSSGAPDQQFRLFATPIDPDSLVLRVAEPVGEDEAQMLGAAADIAGMPGPWVAWTRVDEFPAEGSAAPARLFTVDAERGIVGFGNGRNALVPPMGSAVLALAYRRVAGAAANIVRAGDKLQLFSPIVGVDKVTALDGAAGGADVEAAERARARAPVRLANGGRVVTLADIENHVLARDPTIAQARAENRQGGTRLVVVGTGARLIPPPSAREAIVRALEGAASFGLLTRLTVIGPRLLPIAVKLTAEPDPGVDFVGIEEAAATAILALCDHETGGFHGSGWPVGTLPTIDDIAAALAPLADRAVIGDITIGRAGTDQALPDPFPSDVLVRLARADITVRAYAEAAA